MRGVRFVVSVVAVCVLQWCGNRVSQGMAQAMHLQSVRVCVGEPVTQRLCSEGRVANIQNAYFEVALCPDLTNRHCCLDQDITCHSSVKYHSPDYYEQIVHSCNGREMCNDLLAKPGEIDGECGDATVVNIKYTCQHRGPRLPPVILQGPRNAIVLVESEHTFTCQTRNSSDIVEWFHYQAPIIYLAGRYKAYRKRGTLVFQRVLASDTGPYECRARNSNGVTKSGYAYLKVEEPPYLTTKAKYDPHPTPSTLPPRHEEWESVRVCVGEPVTQRLCSEGRVANIQNAYFEVAQCPDSTNRQCCLDLDTNCQTSVKDLSPDYYEQIVHSCNGREMCNDIWAKSAEMGGDCAGAHATVVIIQYTCQHTDLKKNFRNTLLIPLMAGGAGLLVIGIAILLVFRVRHGKLSVQKPKKDCIKEDILHEYEPYKYKAVPNIYELP